MTYTFKISKRLAHSRSLHSLRLLTATALLVGCGDHASTSPTLTSPFNSIAKVVVTPAAVSRPIGQVTQFSAIAFNANGDTLPGRSVRWTSSNTNIVSVSSNGRATAVAPGIASVIATIDTVRGDAVDTVDAAPVVVASVTVSPGSASGVVGDSTRFAATAKDSSGAALAGVSVVWTSTNTSVVTVDQQGMGRAVGAGTAAVVATAGGKSGQASVSVAAQAPVAVASVTVAPGTASVAVGATQQLTATLKDSAGNVLTGRTVSWTSSAAAVATVSGAGLVTALAAGSATVTAASGGKTGSAAITVPTPVVAPVSVASVTVAPGTATVAVGATQQLTATLKDSAGNVLTGRTVSWLSSAPAVATVSAAGLVTALAAGGTTVTATSGGKTGSAAITVPAPVVAVASVAVAPSAATLLVGATVQLTATLKDAAGNVLTGRTVSWTSSDTTRAVVSAAGLVTARAAGSATVTAASGGQAGTAAITDTAATVVNPTALVQEGFEDGNFASRGWYDNTGMARTTAQHVGGTSALEVHFLAGALTPTWGGAARHLFTPTPSVYLSYWVKYSSNWVGSGHVYHPHEFLFMTTEDGAYTGPSSTHLTTYVEHNYQNGGIPVLDLQDGSNIDQSQIGVDLTSITEDRAANGCNGVIDSTVTGCYVSAAGIYDNEKKFFAPQPYFLPDSGPGYKGDWHFVEAYFQLNSIVNGKGVADGIAQYWFDGQLVIDKTHVLMRTGAHPTMLFNQLLVAPYIGDGSPVDQTMWVDDLTVAASRPPAGAPSRTTRPR